ncbi:NAD(P)-binding protein [Porticoccus sp. GXU_MW_L64]
MKFTRRDFINGVVAGSGAALLSARAPRVMAESLSDKRSNDWYGYGGVGDYADSHGNTPEVVNAAHDIRDGKYLGLPENIPATEEHDLVIVGGGMAGLGAAWHFKKHARAGQTCLMLENHPIFGGESKENEFDMDGLRLIAPQGANGFFVPPPASDPEKASGDSRYYAEFNIPRDLPYRKMGADLKHLKFCQDNFDFIHPGSEENFSMGYFFAADAGARWANNIWQNDLINAPMLDPRRKDLLSWKRSRADIASDDETRAWLDSMSYQQYLEKEFNLGPEGARYSDAFMSAAFGLGSDSVSAYVARMVRMPGMISEQEYKEGVAGAKTRKRNSFPGGNSGFARYFIKNIKPEVIAGSYNFDDIITGAINFDALDKAGDAIRIRCHSTVVSVKHEGAPGEASSVKVVYTRHGKLHCARAKGVVMASGGWVNRHIVKDLPDRFSAAYSQFHHAPMLIANVALTNWRFLYKLGITGARWEEGFGDACNIRPPMLVGRHQPPLDPDKPIVLTFYVHFGSPGLSVQAQCLKGRMSLFFTSYADYERQILDQMTRLFGAHGFNAKKDVRGIILNRWGHAYVVPTPGFFFDTAQGKAPRHIIKEGYGRIAFGHSELEGFQHWGPAADQGRRAVEQLLARVL